jgi:hypothetical protein
VAKAKKSFQRMEKIALSGDEIVLEGGGKYLEMNIFDHQEDLDRLVNGNGNSLTNLIGSVFDFSQINPENLYIKPYEEEYIVSELRFDDNTILKPFNHECALVCSLASNKRGPINVQYCLLQDKEDLDIPVGDLNFRDLRNLKHELINSSIKIRKKDYTQFKFSGETQIIETDAGFYCASVYNNDGMSRDRIAFLLPQCVSIAEKIYDSIKDQEGEALFEDYMETDGLYGEVEAMYNSLKRSKTKLSTYIRNLDVSMQQNNMLGHENSVLLKLQNGKREGLLEAPYFQGLGLNFLITEHLFLNKHIGNREKIEKYII